MKTGCKVWMTMTKFTNRAVRFAPIVVIGWCVIVAAGRVYGQQEAVEAIADKIAQMSGVRSGLIVHYGCGDGRLPAALGRGDSCTVEGLTRDQAEVEQGRQWVAKQQLAGKVTMRCWPEDFLPYADNLVNLLVVEGAAPPPMSEVMRVLAPLGVACIKDRDGWQVTTKPWPGDIDEWTHWLHAADGNPVAKDQRVGPPRAIQWMGLPGWSKSHDTAPSLTGMVTAQGRLFYIADMGPVGICDPEHHFELWHLCARDAFNGIMLWQLPLDDWGDRAWSPGKFPEGKERWAGAAHGGIGPWVSNPRVIHKRLVAQGNRVYVTLGFSAPISQLDAATGKILRTYDGTGFADEMVFDNGVLLVTVDKAAQREHQYGAQPEKSVLAIEPNSGRVLWEHKGFYGVVDGKFRSMKGVLTRLSLTSGGGKVFVRDRDVIVAMEASTGKECWRTASEAVHPLQKPNRKSFQASDPVGDMLYSDGVIYSWQITSERQIPYPIEMLALDAADGSRLWKKDCEAGGFQSMVSAYKARGLVWTLSSSDPAKPRQDTYQLWGLAPRTGEIVKSYDINLIMQTAHHHRCYRNKATENYIIFSRNGLEFEDLRSGEANINRWVRGICDYGIMPANGLTYAPPQQCACYPDVREPGFIVYSAARTFDKQRLIAEESRLSKGPAYGTMITAPELTSDDWPMYRHDGLRSAASKITLPQKLSPAWEREIGEPITAPTLGWNKVFLAGLNTRRVIALDSSDGKEVWAAEVDDRVDTPPTLWQGKVYCGTSGGYVYCLRAENGELVWRFNANPAYERIVVRGTTESSWPVHGSAVVGDGVVYVAAGRSSYVNGGLRFYKLDAETGKQLQGATYETAEIESKQSGFESGKPNNMLLQGAANDLLVYDGRNVYLRNLRVDPKDLSVHAIRWPYTPFTKDPWEKDFAGSPLVCMSGFLDDSLFDRSGYILNQQYPARKLTFSDKLVVGLRWEARNATPGRLLFHEGLYEIGRNHYTVFASKRDMASQPAGRAAGKLKSDQWAQNVDVRASALALTRNAVIVAGSPMSRDGNVSAEFALQAVLGKEGGVLLRLNAVDGTPAEICKFSAPPVWDGIAVNKQGLFVAQQDGKLVKLQ